MECLKRKTSLILSLSKAVTLIGLGFAPTINAFATNHLSSVEPPPFLLAKNYQSNIELSKFYVSEKLDGVRAFWNGINLVTRGGYVIQAPSWFTEDFPNDALDGELWLGRGEFEEVSGMVRRHVPIDGEWRNIRYKIFDLPQDLDVFSVRYQKLIRLLERTTNPYISLVEQHSISNQQALDDMLDSVISLGGEGLMLHRKDSHYQATRSSDLQKIKPYDDEEAIVISHIEGKGKYSNMMGSIEVINKEGVRFKIGSGFSDEERLSPPPINSQITYRFRGKTNKNTPRFATFLRVRNVE